MRSANAAYPEINCFVTSVSEDAKVVVVNTVEWVAAASSTPGTVRLFDIGYSVPVVDPSIRSPANS